MNESKKKTIIFTIEIESRELIPKCQLALKAIEKGFRVYICSSGAVQLFNGQLNSAILFHKSTWNDKVLEFKKNLGAVIVIMDEESGIAIPQSSLEEFCNERYSTVTSEKYDHIFTIGERVKSRE